MGDRRLETDAVKAREEKKKEAVQDELSALPTVRNIYI
jgi:hypothetical protein